MKYQYKFLGETVEIDVTEQWVRRGNGMKVLCDENGLVTSYALVGDLVDGIEVSEPEDVEHFMANFAAYRIRDGDLVFDEVQAQAGEKAQAIEALRERRETECFPIINRGQLWYKHLAPKQKTELAAWYQEWLDVTETQTVPERPAWL